MTINTKAARDCERPLCLFWKAYVVCTNVVLVGRTTGADGVMMSLRVHVGTLTLDAVRV